MKTCVLWKESCDYPYSLVLAEGVLFAGGKDEVAAMATSTGKTLWKAKVKGRALDLALADGRLIVSTDQGSLHCFRALADKKGD